MPDPAPPLQVITVRGPIDPERDRHHAVPRPRAHRRLRPVRRSSGTTPGSWTTRTSLTGELDRYRAAGGGTICDPTNIGIGRQPAGTAPAQRADRRPHRDGRRLVPRALLSALHRRGDARPARRPAGPRPHGGRRRHGHPGRVSSARSAPSAASSRRPRSACSAPRPGPRPHRLPDPDPHDALRRAGAGAARAARARKGSTRRRVIVSHLGDRRRHPLVAAHRPTRGLAEHRQPRVRRTATRRSRCAPTTSRRSAPRVSSDQVMLSNDICVLDQLASVRRPGLRQRHHQLRAAPARARRHRGADPHDDGHESRPCVRLRRRGRARTGPALSDLMAEAPCRGPWSPQHH